ncbi:hypothetical protein L9F63_020990 [Diploptera punctata]|uniref:C2H2-type domain-containing protein n=1 Tax=Diploptera punctata TaxID=6984 RepID=A0AAD8EBS8_DIPPU|nr:hypothetical protein L9F63_020990 [Diploptera punctata]
MWGTSPPHVWQDLLFYTKENMSDSTSSCVMCIKSTQTPSTPPPGTKDRPFSCEVCGKGFTQAAHLTRHTRVHTGEKPFSCGICGKCFTQSGDLTRHARVHTGEKPYSCRNCLKRFSQSGDLSRHTRRAHPGENTFSCDVCLKSFSQSGGLTRHTRVHSTAPRTASATGDDSISNVNFHLQDQRQIFSDIGKAFSHP